MNFDPWQHVLESLEPEIDKLTQLMSNGPKIKPTLRRRANGPNYWYRLQLVEDFGSELANEFVNDHLHSSNLDACVKWVEEKLKEWPDCDRKAWDMWDFKSRREAEKFITLFHVSWGQ